MGDEPGNAIEVEIEIVNDQGLHMRPVMRLTELAMQFKSDIRLCKGDIIADARSPMEMMLLDAPKGTRLKLRALGEDAKAAVEAITEFAARKFSDEG